MHFIAVFLEHTFASQQTIAIVIDKEDAKDSCRYGGIQSLHERS
jgi:hypothetical protein